MGSKKLDKLKQLSLDEQSQRLRMDNLTLQLQIAIRMLLHNFENHTEIKILEFRGQWVDRGKGAFSGHEIVFVAREMTQEEKLEITDIWDDIK